MDQESRKLILYWLLYNILHTDWDDESDAKLKMFILHIYILFSLFLRAYIGYETNVSCIRIWIPNRTY